MPHRYPIASSLALILGCSGGPGSIPADAGVSYYEPPIWGGAFESPPGYEAPPTSGPGYQAPSKSGLGYQDPASTPSFSGDAGSSEGGLAPRCEDCMAAQCGDTMGKCMSNADCKGLYECVTSCGSNTTCLSACTKTFPKGVALASELAQCVKKKCDKDCQ